MGEEEPLEGAFLAELGDETERVPERSSSVTVAGIGGGGGVRRVSEGR